VAIKYIYSHCAARRRQQEKVVKLFAQQCHNQGAKCKLCAVVPFFFEELLHSDAMMSLFLANTTRYLFNVKGDNRFLPGICKPKRVFVNVSKSAKMTHHWRLWHWVLIRSFHSAAQIVICRTQNYLNSGIGSKWECMLCFPYEFKALSDCSLIKYINCMLRWQWKEAKKLA